MIYAWDNNSTQNAHIKHTNDDIQKYYMEKHRDDKAYERFKHIPEYNRKESSNGAQSTTENM